MSTTSAPHGSDRTPTTRTTVPGKEARQSKQHATPHRHAYTAHLDTDVRIVAAEDDFSRLFGSTSREICGRSLYDLLRPSAPSALSRHFSRLSEGRCDRFTERVVGLTGSGQAFSSELTGIAVRDTTGRLAGIIVLICPDTETDAVERERALPGPREHLLSKVDAQVLEGVASGASTVQIAARLYLSRQGVEYHVGLMLRRFKVPNRAALVARAHSMGILTVGQWPPRVLTELIQR